MTIRLVSDEKSRTLPVGIRKMRLDRAENCCYKAGPVWLRKRSVEAAVSALLEKSNIETGLPLFLYCATEWKGCTFTAGGRAVWSENSFLGRASLDHG